MKASETLKITIITVCKNSEQFLSETIESVKNQSYQNIEYIVIDGRSVDNTIPIIKHYSSHISLWKSEEDIGMYDAINKGLRLATGDYILILNSDDVLATNDTIKNVVEQMITETFDYYYGNMIKLKKGKLKKVKLFPVTYKQLLLSTHGTFVPHPCFFVSVKLDKILAGYNLAYRYAADYDYILRALANIDCKGKFINVDITKFRIHNNSITASGKIHKERIKILHKNKYYRIPYLTRLGSYYILWIYYKIINVLHFYKADKG